MHKCSCCRFFFETREEMLKHRFKTHKETVCNICRPRLTFKNSSELAAHRKVRHRKKGMSSNDVFLPKKFEFLLRRIDVQVSRMPVGISFVERIGQTWMGTTHEHYMSRMRENLRKSSGLPETHIEASVPEFRSERCHRVTVNRLFTLFNHIEN